MESRGDRRTSQRGILLGDSNLQGVRRRLDAWRATCRGPSGRIPEALWTAAVERARSDGVERIAEVLRLNVEALGRRVKAAAARAQSPPTQPAFVELGLISQASQCQVQVEAPDGAKLSIRLTGQVPDLPGLLDTFLRRRS